MPETNSSSTNRLTEEDIQKLLTTPSPENKIALVNKISNRYNTDDFTSLQKDRAEKIFRSLIGDAQIEVRKAIANNLVHSRDIPADVILSLARDIEDVACPIIEFSQVIKEDDLIQIILESQSTSHVNAAASRSDISEKVSSAVIDSNIDEAVSSLLDNNSADISTANYERIIDNFADNEMVIDSLATRSAITEKIVNKMVESISDTMKSRLEDRYQTNIEDIHKIFKRSNESATIRLLGQQTIDENLLTLVDNLDAKGQLIDAIKTENSFLNQLLEQLNNDGMYPIIPTLAVGNLPLLCIIFSKITHLPYVNVVKLLSDKRGNEAIYMKAQLPKKLFACVSLVIEVIYKMYLKGEASNTNPIRDNIGLFAQRIREQAHGQHINQLQNFLDIVEYNMEAQSGGW